jgi:hypothetical protein
VRALQLSVHLYVTLQSPTIANAISESCPLACAQLLCNVNDHVNPTIILHQVSKRRNESRVGIGGAGFIGLSDHDTSPIKSRPVAKASVRDAIGRLSSSAIAHLKSAPRIYIVALSVSLTPSRSCSSKKARSADPSGLEYVTGKLARRRGKREGFIVPGAR